MPFTDPSFSLQAAVIKALKADPGVAAIVADRVFDRVERSGDGKPKVPYPYIALGNAQVLPENAECTDAATAFVTLHLWSQAVGFPEVKQLGIAVSAALDDATLVIEGGTLQSLLLQSTNYLRDPDGLTSHAVLTFQALTDAN